MSRKTMTRWTIPTLSYLLALPAAALAGESNRINIEEAMKEFNNRYMWFNASDSNSNGRKDADEIAKAPAWGWPACEGCGITPTPPRPAGAWYEDRMEDWRYAQPRVQAVVDAFYGSALYGNFINGESDDDPLPFYTLSDFPKTWSGDGSITTEAECRAAAKTITEYVKRLKGEIAVSPGTLASGEIRTLYVQGLWPIPNEAFAESCPLAVALAKQNLETFPEVMSSGLSSTYYGQTTAHIHGGTPPNNVYSASVESATDGTGDISFDLSHLTSDVTIEFFVRAEGESYSYATGLETTSEWVSWTSAQGGDEETPMADLDWYTDEDSFGPVPCPGPEVDDGTAYVTYAISGLRAIITPKFPSDTDPPEKCEACDSGGCKAPSAYDNGSVKAWFGLGPLDDESSAGHLQIHEETPAAFLATPTALRPVADNAIDDATHVIRSSGVVRQVWTEQTLADIVTINSYKYEIRWYRADQVGALSGGLYPINSGQTPFKVVIVENPNASSDANNLRFTEKDEAGTVALVNEFVWNTTEDAWELYEGLNKTTPTLASAAKRTLKTDEWDAERTHRTVTQTEKNAAGSQTLAKTVEVYRWFPAFGEKLVSRTVDPDGAALTETWDYWTTGDGLGELKLYASQTGYWERYEYDEDGIRTKTVAQLGGEAYDDSDPEALEGTNLVTGYATFAAELNDADSVNESIAKTTISSAGQPVRASYRIDWSGTQTKGGASVYEVWTVKCASADPEQGYGSTTAFLNALMASSTHLGHRVTREWRYASGDHEHEPKQVLFPDGQMAIYDRSVANQTTVSHGWPDDAAASSPAITHGTKTITLVTDSGQPLETKTQRRENGGSWFTLSLVKTTDADDFDRPLETSYWFGTAADAPGSNPTAYTTETAYGCCGVSSRTDRSGLETAYGYDDLKRQTQSTTPDGITTHYTYDAAGRTLTVEREGTDTTSVVTSTTTYDLAGRVTTQKDALDRYAFYTYRWVKPDGSAYTIGTDTGPRYEETRVYPHSATSGPIQVIWTDSHGRTVRTWTAKPGMGVTWSSGSPPSASATIVELGRETMAYDWAGRATSSRSYFDLTGLDLDDAGTAGTHYHESSSVYDVLGQLVRSTDAMGNVGATVYDQAGRAIERWQGTNAAGATPSDPTGGASGGNNMVKVGATFYDLNHSGGGSDYRDYATRQSRLKPIATLSGTSSDYTHVDFEESYDTGNERRILWNKPASGAGPWQKQLYDYEGRLLESVTYQNGSTTYVLAKASSVYTPGSGYLTASRVYEVDGSGGLTGKYLETTYGYDDAGRQVRVASAEGGFTKTAFDPHGRTLRSVTASTEGTNTDPDVFTDDTVLTETVYHYDVADQVIRLDSYDRRHDASSMATGLLSSGSGARITYSATWYDDAGRPTHEADYGTNGGSSFTRPGTPPEPDSSDDILVTKLAYDEAGRRKDATDNKGVVTRTEYDALGRVTKLTENYADGTPGNGTGDDDRVTTYAYNADGQVTLQTADLPTGSTDQTTRYVYSAELADKGGPVKSNSLLRATIWPDSTSTVSGNALSGTDLVSLTYLADGSVHKRKDQRGVELTYAYDDARRRTSQTVTAGTVPGDQKMAYAYDDLGRLDTVTTYSDTGSTISGQVKTAYNGLGQVTTEYQDHDSAVNTSSPGSGGSPRIVYAYDTTAASNKFTKGHRRTSVTYPNGRQVNVVSDGHSGIDDATGRVNKLVDDGDSSVIASYAYLGSRTAVKKEYPVPGVRLSYLDATGDPYDEARDRFGRIKKHRWTKYDTSTGDDWADLFDIRHGYDRASNRLYAENQIHDSASQKYTYDSLHRLTQYKAGLLKSDQSDTEAHWTLQKQAWNLDHLGNARDVDTVDASDWTASTFNAANEIATRNVRGGAARVKPEDGFGTDTSAHWSLPVGASSDAFSVTGGYLQFTSVGQDTFGSSPEAEAQAFAVWGGDIGPVTATVAVLFPPGATSGQAGLVLGYKGTDAAYWAYVADLGAQKIRLYRVQSWGKELLDETAATITAGTTFYLDLASNRGAIDYFPNTPFSEWPSPGGRMGLYTNLAPVGGVPVKFDAVTARDAAWPRDRGGRWDDPTDGVFSASGRFRAPASVYSGYDPAYLRGVRAKRFEATFAFRRGLDGSGGATSGAQLGFVFNGRDADDYDFVNLYHDTASPTAPYGYGVDGIQAALVSGTRDSAQVPSVAAGDPLWVRVAHDGSSVTVKCATTEGGLSSATACYTSSSLVGSGLVGFVARGSYPEVDDLTLKTDRDSNGSYETTEHVETFTTGTGSAASYTEEALTHDAAGNLTYDGVFAYAYDAWNRLVEVKKAYRAGNVPAGSLSYGSVVQTSRYDCLGRRIVKAVQNSADLDFTHHYYFDGESVAEERNGSDAVVKHYVWASLADGYVDELVQTVINGDPVNDPGFDPGDPQHFARDYWAVHDANFNVIGLVVGASFPGLLEERYEYTPYGERQVFIQEGYEDFACHSPVATSYLGAVGHQGLFHDEEAGLIYNRARTLHPSLDRFVQRDPLGYVDGMNAYLYILANPTNLIDHSGRVACTEHPADYVRIKPYSDDDSTYYGRTDTFWFISVVGNNWSSGCKGSCAKLEITSCELRGLYSERPMIFYSDEANMVHENVHLQNARNAFWDLAHGVEALTGGLNQCIRLPLADCIAGMVTEAQDVNRAWESYMNNSFHCRGGVRGETKGDVRREGCDLAKDAKRRYNDERKQFKEKLAACVKLAREEGVNCNLGAK